MLANQCDPMAMHVDRLAGPKGPTLITMAFALVLGAVAGGIVGLARSDVQQDSPNNQAPHSVAVTVEQP